MTVPSNAAPDGPRSPRPPMPKWVKTLLLVALLIGVVFVVMAALGIEHGPGLHSSSSFVAPLAIGHLWG